MKTALGNVGQKVKKTHTTRKHMNTCTKTQQQQTALQCNTKTQKHTTAHCKAFAIILCGSDEHIKGAMGQFRIVSFFDHFSFFLNFHPSLSDLFWSKSTEAPQ